MEERHEVCILLDKLYLDMLKTVEEKVQCQINIEKATASGSIHIAKSRYIMGQQAVSSVQLPTEHTPEFSSLATVDRVRKSDNLADEKFDLHIHKSELDSPFINPIKWFGLLVPQNLHQAQQIYQNALSYVIECVNIQRHLDSTCTAIAKLKSVKDRLKPEE